MEIVLELGIGDDFTGALTLVSEDAAFERAVGLGGAGLRLSLRGQSGSLSGLSHMRLLTDLVHGSDVTLGGTGEWHRVVFEVARVICGASLGCLGGHEGGCCQGGESDCVLHVDGFGCEYSCNCRSRTGEMTSIIKNYYRRCEESEKKGNRKRVTCDAIQQKLGGLTSVCICEQQEVEARKGKMDAAGGKVQRPYYCLRLNYALAGVLQGSSVQGFSKYGN